MELLDTRYEAFCQEYMLNGFNSTRAYMAVYPDAEYNSARALSSKLLANISITERIAELRAEMTIKYGINIQEVVNSIKETRGLAKSQNDFNASLKADDMLLKVADGYATEKVKSTHQFLDKNGEPTDPPSSIDVL